jgi:hypothetical protein
MPYAPTVNDESGQILAGYQTRSAEITAAGNEALTKGIVDGSTSAISGIAGAYTQAKMQAAGGKAFKDFMGVAGPSMGITDEQLKSFKTMNDQDAYQMSQMFMPVAPSMVSASGIGKYYSALAGNHQKAMTQRELQQPAPNEQVVPTMMTSPAATSEAPPAAASNPSWFSLIKPRPRTQQP